ncbi:MAG: Maf family protein [Anaerolineae bacterium]
MRIALASASPRRHELLERLGLAFDIQPSWVEERLRDGELPADMARRLARKKALASFRANPAGLVVAADTLVVLDNETLGKPTDPEEARSMLWRLRGREHNVVTGLALLAADRGCVLTQVATTPVRMRAYSHVEVASYVATGDPMDKAGAYAIQHGAFSPVERLGDCYANVVGLPLCHLVRGLRRLGINVPRDPIEACPYAVEHGGCIWSQRILEESQDLWGFCASYDTDG